MKKKISSLFFLIKNKTLFKHFLYKIKGGREKIVSMEDQNNAAKKFFSYKYNCIFPRTFNEYLGWIKINYRNQLWCKCADKLGTKDFLKTIGLDCFCPRTLAVYEKVQDINLEELPDRFVLKANNDSGSVFVCDKSKTNFNEVFGKLNDAINNDYSKNGEWVYENVKPIIFAEELIIPKEGDDLIDYKFFVYNGSFKWGFTGQNRNKDCRFCVFEKNFEIQKVDYIYLRPPKKQMPKRPESFEKMVKMAEEIGKHFLFVRVDFYESNKGPMIGELTFFSQSGFGSFTKNSFDIKYGHYFEEIPFYQMVYGKDKKE